MNLPVTEKKRLLMLPLSTSSYIVNLVKEEILKDVNIIKHKVYNICEKKQLLIFSFYGEVVWMNKHF